MTDSNWQKIAWNGISFLAPKHWQPEEIGKDRLSLSDSSGPVMELKWGKVKGAFSAPNYLKRLFKHNKKQFKKEGMIAPIPVTWEKAIRRFKSSGFSWQQDLIKGRGLLLFCSKCKTVSLIQFFEKQEKPEESHILKILSSYTDHRDDQCCLWQIYNIQALIPIQFSLASYKFEAGYLEINFKSKLAEIRLNRWGPASVVLEEQSLLDFAKTVFPLAIGEPREILVSGENALEWEKDYSHQFLKTFVSKFKTQKSYHLLRIWTVSSKNRILAIQIEAKAPLEPGMVYDMLKSYETV